MAVVAAVAPFAAATVEEEADVEDERTLLLMELLSREFSWCTGNIMPGISTVGRPRLTSTGLTSRLSLFLDLSITATSIFSQLL